jgi:hypothetical protein
MLSQSAPNESGEMAKPGSESPAESDSQTDAFPNDLASDQGDAATAIPTNPPMDPTSRRIRTSGTHQQLLSRLERNESDETANPGLLNNGVLCYANAIFQALAHFNHNTSLFNNPPPDDKHDTLQLNHTFCTVLHLLVRRPLIQGSVVDPGNFVNLFTDIHEDFVGVECKFC